MKKIRKVNKKAVGNILIIIGLVLLPICHAKAADFMDAETLIKLAKMAKRSMRLMNRAILLIKPKYMKKYIELLHPTLEVPAASSTFSFLPSIIICSTLTGVLGGLVYEALMSEELP